MTFQTGIVFALAVGAAAWPLMAQARPDDKKIPDYSQLERRDVPVESTWKVEDIYATPQAWRADLEKLGALVGGVEAAAEGWTSSARKMNGFLQRLEEIRRLGRMLSAYASLQKDADMGNPAYTRMLGEVQPLLVKLSEKLAFLHPDILALGGEAFSEYVRQEPQLAAYRFFVGEVLRGRQHVLPADQQRIVALTGLFTRAPESAAGMLNNVEIPPAEITLSDGRRVVLNQANYERLRSSPLPEDRQLVMETFWGNRKRYEKTLALLLDGAVNQHWFGAQARRYPDCLEARLFDDAIDARVYHQLIASVRAALPALHRYLALKKRILGLERFRYADVFAPAVPAVDRRYTFAEAGGLLLEVLKPLGPDYRQALQSAFSGRWIDVYANRGKQSGAYSSGVYGVHPFVKLNYNGQYDSVSTLAHELGHAMHSRFAERAQPFATAGYPTFLAEIASTFNENLLMDHLARHEPDDRFKLSVIDGYLERVRATLYRQTLFAEFELAMHRRVESGQALTPDWLDQTYLDLTRAYYGHDRGVCEVGDYLANEWSGVPHFYMNYYVFQYSTGIIASMALSDMVLNGGAAERDRYLGLLKAGGSDHPITLLLAAGVDMTTPAPAEAAFRRFDRLVGEMEAIVDRLEKGKKAGK